MKAMILAAGSGKRLQPLTFETPKALLEVKGKQLIVYQLERIQRAGINDVIINLSHHSDKIRKTLGNGSKFGINIEYSQEPEGGYETGGGIVKALPLLGNSNFIVINCDLYTNYDLNTLPKQIEHLAHLVMVDNPDHHSKGDFALIDNKIVNQTDNRLTFAGIAMYHPDLFRELEVSFFRLSPILQQAIDKQQVTGEHFTGRWYNINSLESYNRLKDA